MFPFESPTLLAPIGEWFSKCRRQLPWRAEDLDLPHSSPYAVLVSELMLQQTQVATVIPYFQRWMSRFPDVRSLADADDQDVHKLWEGLGYYRRARFLKQAASVLVKDGWPGNLDGLLALPGLGPYTAAAVASIAFQWPEPALDGNAFRVLARILNIQDDPRSHAKTLRAWLRPALAAHGPSRMTQAIMELGATSCTPRPACARCPMAGRCEAFRYGLTDRIPPVKPRLIPEERHLWLVAIRAEDHWLLLQPSEKGLLSGLWRWPTCPLDPPETSILAAERPVPYRTYETKVWKGWTQVYSHRKEHVHPLMVILPERFSAPSGSAWIAAKDLPALPLGNRDQRMKSRLEENPQHADLHIPTHVIQRIMTVFHDPPGAKSLASEAEI